MDRNKVTEIPLGAFDSELKGWEYTIPEGMKARIEGNKVILEPKESEDKRIRKQLLNWFKDCHWDSIDEDTTPLKRDDIIAWFERQGEHFKFWESIQIGDEVTRNPDGVLVNLSQLKRKAEQNEQNLANSTKTCKDEHNPTLPDFEEREGVAGRDYIPVEWVETIENYGKWKIVRTDEQNPAWSEEDEKMYERCLSYAHHNIPVRQKDGYMELKKEDDKEIIGWLKSLKERCTWKPSDEQIKALEYVLLSYVDSWQPELQVTFKRFKETKKIK